MKTTILTLIFATASQLHAGLIPMAEHVDIRWRWETPGVWTCQAVTDSNGEVAHETPDVSYQIAKLM